MKIGVMGTHGAGKTTYVNEIANRIVKRNMVGILEEVARRCPFPVNKQTSVNAQTWIYHTQIVKEIELEAAHDILICDRTILDGIAYAQRAGLEEFVDAYLFRALSWLDTYDFLCWIRPGRLPEDDEFRDTDPIFQAEIDNILEAWIEKFGITAQICNPDKKLWMRAQT